MPLWRRLAPLALIACIAMPVGVTSASMMKRGALSGTWSGWLAAVPAKGIRRLHITITVNSAQTGGSWKISNVCQGPLTLQSISSGYHHYLRHLAHGSSCAGGDIDCLMRMGANMYDSVTSHLGGAYDTSGTLRRT